MALFSEQAQKLSQFIGNPSAISDILKWGKEWSEGRAQRPLLIYGPPGCGKTSLAYAAAEHFGWIVFELNASDFRGASEILARLPNAASSHSLSGAMRAILIDDVDSLSGTADSGGMAAIMEVAKNTRQPFIFTACDAKSKKMFALSSLCFGVELRRPSPSTLRAFLEKEAQRRGIEISGEELDKIASLAQGDVRAALNDLEAKNPSARDREKNIFDTLRALFSATSYSEAQKSIASSDTDIATLRLWIAQNVQEVKASPIDIARSYDFLSKSDIFEGRIAKTQHWGYLKYSKDFAIFGASSFFSYRPPPRYFKLSYPEYLRSMGATKSARAMRKGVLSKISKACHCSLSQASGYVPLFQEFARKKAPICSIFEEDELAFILGKSGKEEV